MALITFAIALMSGTSLAASSNATYFAIYCNKDNSKLNLTSKTDTLGCSQSADPGIETTVKSLTTNPKGAHDVTIVEADCYPDKPNVSATSTINDGNIPCSNGPDATLTLGHHYAADKKAAAAAKKKGKTKNKNGGPANPSNVQTQINMSPITPGGLPSPKATTNTIQTALGIFFAIIGAFALLSMTASGLKYVTSGGDPGKTSEAKKGVAFALVGLALAISAEAIVAFVIHRGAP